MYTYLKYDNLKSVTIKMCLHQFNLAKNIIQLVFPSDRCIYDPHNAKKILMLSLINSLQKFSLHTLECFFSPLFVHHFCNLTVSIANLCSIFAVFVQF